MRIKIYNLDRKLLKELQETFSERPIWQVEPADGDCVDVTLSGVELTTHVSWIELRYVSSIFNVQYAEYERIEIS